MYASGQQGDLQFAAFDICLLWFLQSDAPPSHSNHIKTDNYKKKKRILKYSSHTHTHTQIIGWSQSISSVSSVLKCKSRIMESFFSDSVCKAKY